MGTVNGTRAHMGTGRVPELMFTQEGCSGKYVHWKGARTHLGTERVSGYRAHMGAKRVPRHIWLRNGARAHMGIKIVHGHLK